MLKEPSRNVESFSIFIFFPGLKITAVLSLRLSNSSWTLQKKKKILNANSDCLPPRLIISDFDHCACNCESSLFSLESLKSVIWSYSRIFLNCSLIKPPREGDGASPRVRAVEPILLEILQLNTFRRRNIWFNSRNSRAVFRTPQSNVVGFFVFFFQLVSFFSSEENSFRNIKSSNSYSAPAKVAETVKKL